MALNNLGLGILLEAKDEFSSVMERAKHKFGETDKAATGEGPGEAWGKTTGPCVHRIRIAGVHTASYFPATLRRLRIRGL